MTHASLRLTLVVCMATLVPVGGALAQEPLPSPLLSAGETSELPLVHANDNTRIAGALRDGIRVVDLEVTRADWRVEGAEGPGLRVAAIAEAGAAPEIPAPLLRTEAGTHLVVTVRNRLPAPVTVFGLHARPAEAPDSFVVAPGQVETKEFDAGEPGTYMYWMREGPALDRETMRRTGERDQLAGALVVDPRGTRNEDRVLVMNIFSRPIDLADPDGDWVEALAVNGLSWPFTERMRLEVGDDVRWRVINASNRNHPMHLHGFFYSVLSRGTATGDTVYAERDHRLVVTETMRRRTTMAMAWTPTRPGRWLFHCHLSFHVSPELRLPGAAEAGHGPAHTHMAGLVTGIEVAPGPTDLVRRGPPVRVELHALEQPADEATTAETAEPTEAEAGKAESRTRYVFSLGGSPDGSAAGPTTGSVPGPLLTFQQHQAVDVTVHNRLSVPTGVHWHGLELDAWADGVPDWSASDGKVSPTIQPGESFTYRLSLMRPGTFIYHTHLDDIEQLTRGLYGPLLVLPEGESYDPRTDHLLVWGWNPFGRGIEGIDLNGRREQPDATARVGERHRFRLVNIAPAGNITAWITRNDDMDDVVLITLHAKDGADLPVHQRVSLDYVPRLFVGETVDFTWMPAEPGSYELRVGVPREGRHIVQRWTVTR